MARGGSWGWAVDEAPELLVAVGGSRVGLRDAEISGHAGRKSEARVAWEAADVEAGFPQEAHGLGPGEESQSVNFLVAAVLGAGTGAQAAERGDAPHEEVSLLVLGGVQEERPVRSFPVLLEARSSGEPSGLREVEEKDSAGK